MICKNCQKKFDVADRATPLTNEGAEAQIEYCSERCARQAENRRYYQAHKEEVKRRVRENQKR